MRRAGSRSIKGAKRDLHAMYEGAGRDIALATLLFLPATAAVTIVLFVISPMVAGFILGAAVASYAWGIAFFVRTNDPFFARRMGGKAEIWTSNTLRTLRSTGWHVIDAVEFDGWDVDHVLVGPRGVFAIETKWASVPVRLESDGAIQVYSGDAARQARNGARKIRLLLKSSQVEAQVKPVVVLWGRGAPRLDSGRRNLHSDHGDVLLLEGRSLEDNLDAFDATPLDQSDIDVVVHLIETFVAQRDRASALVAKK